MSAGPRDSVRLSLRLLSTARVMEREADALMRARFQSTLARFDFLSALERHGALTLGEVSQYLLVSNGNITQLAARLKADGLVETRGDQNDRRVQRVSLTPFGELAFKCMAKAHGDLVCALLGDLKSRERQELMHLLDRTRAAIRSTKERGATP